MSYSNGKIYSEIVNGVKIGISPDDVKAVLSHNSYNVKELCMSTKINMWAKYKPEVINQYHSITLAQRKLNNFGLVPSQAYEGITALRNAVANDTFTGGWTYNRVGANDFGRLDDFANSVNDTKVGYNHNAKCPFGSILPFEGTLTTNTNQRLIIPLDAPPQIADSNNDDGQLMITDFENAMYPLKDWYLGVLLYSSARYFVGFCANKFSQNGEWQVDFGYIDPSYAGTYKGVPFLASGKDVNAGGLKIVGIGTKGVTVKLTSISNKVVMMVSCCFVSATSKEVAYTAEITNGTAAQIVLGGVGINIATSMSGVSSQAGKSWGSVTIAAGATWSQTGRFTVPNRSYQYCNFVTSTATYGNISTGWMQFEDAEDVPIG